MTLDDEVRLIIANTLKSMPKEWRRAVLSRDCFITMVRDNTYSFSGDGLIPKDYIIVDFTKSGVPTDAEIYKKESVELYDMFASIEKWYGC